MARYCGAIHPESPQIACNKSGEGPTSNHPDHTGMTATGFLDWPNEAFQPTPSPSRRGRASQPSKNKGLLEDMARRTQVAS